MDDFFYCKLVISFKRAILLYIYYGTNYRIYSGMLVDHMKLADVVFEVNAKILFTQGIHENN